ncbi:MAG: peptide deformylase [Bacillota bacterium]
MSVRMLRYRDDPALRTAAKEIKEITPTIIKLLDDMLETIQFSSNGIALAAPQVGIPKRVVVIETDDKVYELINPRIVAREGSIVEVEGCLSFPDVWGEVERAEKVTVEALDRHGQTIRVEGTGLLARAFQHEIDHLDGILFVDKVIRFVTDDDE